MTATKGNAFLVAADLLEHGAVTDETRAEVRARIGAELRASMSEGARKAVADAYRAKGEQPPEWCR